MTDTVKSAILGCAGHHYSIEVALRLVAEVLVRHGYRFGSDALAGYTESDGWGRLHVFDEYERCRGLINFDWCSDYTGRIGLNLRVE